MTTAVFRCMKCKANKTATIKSEKSTKNGAKMIMSACPKCETRMCRFAKK